MYLFYNANPKGNRVEDCAIRAISLATFRPYKETYRMLAREASEEGLMLNSVKAVELFLDKRYERECFNITLDEFVETHPYNIYVVAMPGHLTCVMNGIVFDIFNPGKRQITCSWKIK